MNLEIWYHYGGYYWGNKARNNRILFRFIAVY